MVVVRVGTIVARRGLVGALLEPLGTREHRLLELIEIRFRCLRSQRLMRTVQGVCAPAPWGVVAKGQVVNGVRWLIHGCLMCRLHLGENLRLQLSLQRRFELGGRIFLARWRRRWGQRWRQ